MFLFISGVSKDSEGKEPVRILVSRQYQTKKTKKNNIYIYIHIYTRTHTHQHTRTRTFLVYINPIATCILVHSGLIKILKQLAYIWEETRCRPDVNIARIVLMTYWFHYCRVIEPSLNFVLAGN